LAADITLIDGEYGNPIDFTITKEDGTPDDLTVYSDVKIVLSTSDFSANVLNHSTVDPENISTQYSTGIITWLPSSNNPVPAFGYYWIQIIRIDATRSKPVKKIFLEIVRGVTHE